MPTNKLLHLAARAATALLLTAIVSACGGAPNTQRAQNNAPASASSGSGGTLTIAMSAGNVPYPNTPPNEGGEGSRFVGRQIYDGILNFNLDQGETVPVPVPGLAESWSVADDQLTWTFKLRKGVTFHDGSAFDAEAVIFQLNRVSNKEFAFFDPQLQASNRTYLIMVESYRAVDAFTVEIKTTQPYSYLPWDMALILIPSPTIVKRYGNEEYVNYASGTGPFRMTRYVNGEVMELEPNAEYWGGKPKLDKIILRPMPDPTTRLAALQSGDVNWAEVPPPDAIAQLKAQGYNVLLGPYPHSIVLFLNLNKQPLDNPKVRQALQYAIDREKLCKDLLNGVCTPAHQYVYKGHFWYNNEFGDTYSYNPEKAKQLLAEAGYAEGFSISVSYPTGGSGNMWPGPMMEFMQSNFAAIGVKMEMLPMEWNNIVSIYRSGFDTPENQKYDGMYFSPSYSSPSFVGFTSWRTPPTGCCNPTGYVSPEVDELFGAAMQEFDAEQQLQLTQQAMGVVAAESPALFIVHDLNLRVMAPEVQGFVQPQSWFADFRNVWVEE